MVYRDDVEALEARHRALETELAQRTRERDDVARLLAEARERAAYESRLLAEAMAGVTRRKRQRTLIASAIATAAVIVGAAEYRSSHRGADRTAALVARYAMFADEICRCSDMACTTRTTDKMTAWAAELAREDPLPAKIDEASMKRMTELAERFTRCMTVAMRSEAAAENPTQ
jgi:hypothetical protein